MKEEEKLTNEEYKILKEALKSNEPMTELKSKEQRALEIIKKKKVNVKWLKDCKQCSDYNILVYQWYLTEEADLMRLTKEEYDLLKEVLL